MNTQRWLLMGAVAALVSGCMTTPIETGAQGAAAGTASTDGWNGSRLYARDGSVIGQAPAPGAEHRTAAARELESADGGRMYILELYQKAIDERDALHGELAALRTELRSVQEALIASEADLDAVDVQLEQLRAENTRLVNENVDLAARLTTAQIRRLQVEKILLEMRVEELKLLQAAAAGGAVAGPAADAGERKQ
ncbi:MAG: hypothetical protein JNN27_08030 [Planctomycetes bacterium]|nr:hypothetical protein [Planctomycetota bacterium]